LTASLEYFEFQETINTHFYGLTVDPSVFMHGVHGLLTRSSLSAPILSRLGSDADIQRIAADAPPAALATPLMQYHLGARLISERNYAAAVGALRRSEELPELWPPAFRLRVYALCMSGRTDDAQTVAEERSAQISDDASGRPFWVWMKKTFGVDPLAKTRSSQH
jgi:hypothetical protein